MTHRQRIRAALAHRQPDRVPLDLGGTGCSTMTAAAHSRLRVHLGIPAEPPAPLFSRRGSTAIVDRAIVERFQCDVLPLVPGAPATVERNWSANDSEGDPRPDEEDLLRVAAEWGFNPMTLEDRDYPRGVGLVGRPR